MGFIARGLKERRDSLANPSKWLVLAFGGGTDTASGLRVNEIVAMRNLAFATAVKIIAETVAQLPLPVYRRTDTGKERIPKHYLYKLLDRQPNERMTAFTFRETLTTHLLTWGNAYAFIDTNNRGQVTGLYPLLPDRTRPQLDQNGKLIYATRIKFDPNSVSPNDQQQIYLRPDQVLHVVGPSFDGLKGRSLVADYREAIGLGLALEEYAARFFGNGAVPGLVLQTDKNLTPDQRKGLETVWDENHRGLTNAQRVAILEAGLKVEKIGIPPEDAQFLESRQFSRNQMAMIFRIPPHMLADVERSTSWGTGIEQQAIGFIVYTMLPWFERWQQAINTKLFLTAEQDEFFCEFVVDALLRGDTQTRYAAYNMAFGKWMTGNTIAAKENLPELGPGGDRLYTPSGAQPLDESGDPIMPQELPADPSQEGPSAASAPKFDVRSREQLARAHEVAFHDIADRILRRERADLSRNPKADLDAFYSDHRDYVQRQAAPALSTYADSVRILVETELGRPVPKSKQFDSFVASYAEAFAKRHSEESRAFLDGTAVGLERAFGTSSRRAERIAQYETVKAGNAFARALYREAGVQNVRWVVGDDRPDCLGLNGRVVPMNTPFVRNIGHPPMDAECRCVIAAEVPQANPTPPAQPQRDGMVRALEALAQQRSAAVNLRIVDGKAQEDSMDSETRDIMTTLIAAVTAMANRPQEIVVKMDAITIPAPVVNMPPITVPAPVVNIPPIVVQNMPEPRGDLEIVYDRNGKVTGTRRKKPE